ncbi:MAG: N-acetylmuramoyl-L-alanine amidase, partial [Abditibacteriota bacterium]|nr:N-acetylmuramoyl-L-alanine amidase [Abditibacteriota bacterium]
MKKFLLIIALAAMAQSLFAGELADIYFTCENQPVGVHRWFEDAPTPESVVREILKGVNGDEAEDGLYSAVPANWVLDSVTENGAFLDINFKPLPKGTRYSTSDIEDIWVQFDKSIRYKFDLTPRLFIGYEPIGEYEEEAPNDAVAKPFIPLNERIKSAPAGVLSGRLIAVRGGHGWVYDTDRSKWVVQRGNNCAQYITCEDFHTLDLTNILITYLEQEGADIVHCRERNKQRGNSPYDNHPWWQMATPAYIADQGYPSSLYGGTVYGGVAESRYSSCRLANYRGADLYLSIHTNALQGDCYSGCGTGLESFWSDNHEAAGSQRIAQLCLDNCLNFVRTYYDSTFYCRRSCKATNASYSETRRPTMPSTLFEFGFHDNCAKDAKYLGDNFFRTVGMYGVAKAVCDYYGVTPKWGPYSAEYVSDTIPTSVRPGETRQVSITFKNHGFCWQSAKDFKVGCVGGTAFGVNRCELPGEIMPGDVVTFTFNMTFPTASGEYNTQWQMLRENVTWFGDVVNKTVRVVNPEEDARYISDTVPDVVVMGESRNVSVTFKNEGRTTWARGSMYRLGAVDDSDPFYTQGDRVELPNDVAPGETVTVSFKMNFTTGGVFTTDWSMVHDGVTWFGDVFSKQVTVLVPERAAQYVSDTIPDTAVLGESRNVSVTFRNIGTMTWTRGQEFMLGAVDDSDPFFTESDRVLMPHDVAPGETVTFTLNMKFNNGGVFTTDWRMLQEHVAWFGDTLTKQVTVTVPEYAARYVSDTIPETAVAGETRTVSVTFKNIGSTAWPVNGMVTLGAVGGSDPFSGSNYIRLPNDVASGDTVTVTFDMTFTEGGSFNTDWRMVFGEAGWFGDICDKTVTVIVPERNAQYIDDTIPASVGVGEARPVTVTFKNTGTMTWTSAAEFMLGAADDEDIYLGGDNRVALPHDVAPGETVTFSFNMTFPTAGVANVVWRMVQEHVAWFGDSCSKTVTVADLRTPTVFYVSPDGNDANDGLTRATPWRTFTNGDSKNMLMAGDRIVLMGGTHTVSSALGTDIIINCGGVTYAGEDGAKIVNDKSRNANHDTMTTCMQVAANNITVENIDFSGAVAPLIINMGGGNITVRDCKFRDTDYRSEWPHSMGINLDSDAAVTVENCEFYNIGTANPAGLVGAAVFNLGAFANSSPGVQRRYIGNYIHDVNGRGILIGGGATNDLVYNNTIARCTQSGIIAMGHNTDSTYAGTATAVNNIVVDCGQGLGLENDGCVLVNHHNLIWDCASTDTGAQVVYGEGTLESDPLFDGEPNLSVYSPAVNSGVDVGRAYTGSAPDMGAFESDFIGGDVAYVTGRVTDRETGEPVKGAVVSVSGCPSVTTDARGVYTITVDRARVLVNVTSEYFNSASAGVSSPLGSVATADFALVRNTLVWDVYEDFSETTNPNGVWTYGFELPRESADGTTFTAYPLCVEAGYGDKSWKNGEDWDNFGYVGYRPVEGVHDQWGHWRPPYTVYLGSSFGSGWSAVRFTAPFDGKFTFNIKFQPCGIGAMGATAYIDRNGVNLYTDTLTGTVYGGAAETSANTLSRRFTLSMTAGETVEFTEDSYTAYQSCSLLPVFRVTTPKPAIEYTDISTPAAIDNLEDGTDVNMTADAKVITGSGTFDDNSVYVESGVFAGCKLIIPDYLGAVNAGDNLRIKGQVKSDADGKYIEARDITRKSSGDPVKTIGMTNNMLSTNALVRAWGRILSASEGTMVINNGS